MATFVPRLSVLPERQSRLWKELQPAARLGFVLYGGTAIALRLGHRTSVDFDFFTETHLSISDLRTEIAILRNALVLQEGPDTFSVFTSPEGDGGEAVKVSFFGSIEFGRVGTPEWTSDGIAQVASCEDLLATKLKVLLQRVESKDYLDIKALLESGVALDRGLSAARALFGPAFQPSESLKALVYFEGGDLHTLSQETKESLIRAARSVRDLPRVPLISRRLSTS